MRNLILAVLLGASASAFSQETLNNTLEFDGETREYITYVPENYSGDEAVPLLFNFHGYGSNANEQMQYGDFRPVADSAGCIVVHPDGLPDIFGVTHWNVGWGFSGTVDDVGFINALLDQLETDYNIDTDRVYSTGMSNGGYISHHLACNLSHRITAIASVTGSMSAATLANPTVSHVTPVLQIHGTDDTVVEYDGSAIAAPIPEVMQFWRNANQTASEANVTDLPDNDPDDGSTVEHFVWEAGECNSRVELYKVNGGSHTWPGAPVDLGGTNYDFDAVATVWNFLSQWSLADLGCAASVENPQAQTQVRVHPNPTSDFVELPHVGVNDVVSVSNLSGQTVIEFTGQSQLDLRSLPSGVYLVEWGGRIVRVVKQ